MRYFRLLVAALRASTSVAKMLTLDVGNDPELPSCGSHCMVDSMFVTQCLDMMCLCNEEEYQKSLFQCLYSQCDPNEYGQALSRTITTCMALGAKIYMVAPGTVNDDVLRLREADYLAGREVADVPGLQLRQESVPATTVTTTYTEHLTWTVTLTPTPTPYPFLPADPVASSINRPWVITQSDSSRSRSSFSGLVLWVALVLLQDYWMNGYWG
ncbi:hypothetical protein F5Y17DRAFT_468777 [Xylariaceae sp. FL0594]|nr:hypothetical protein F5Y17DRAFT_468777 [Xylariaceae sp. FL0594]